MLVGRCTANWCRSYANEPFVQFFCFRGDAGHDYGTIETKSYRKLVVERNGDFEIIDNPKWK